MKASSALLSFDKHHAAKAMDIPAILERSLVVMLQLAFQKQFATSAHRVENFLRLTYPKLNGFDYSIKTVAAALFALEQLDGSAGNRTLNVHKRCTAWHLRCLDSMDTN
jgi:hypothetical protein